MPATGLIHYNLRAPRALLDALKAFYCDVLGLSVGPRAPFDNFGYWLYADGHDILHLSEARPGEVRHTQVATTFDHVAFSCTDPDAMESRLLARQIEYKVSYVPGSRIKQIFLHDPAGNGVELNFLMKGG